MSQQYCWYPLCYRVQSRLLGAVAVLYDLVLIKLCCPGNVFRTLWSVFVTHGQILYEMRIQFNYCLLEMSLLKSKQRVLIAWPVVEILFGILEAIFVSVPAKRNEKPSIGRRLLPDTWKQNETAVVLANTLVWIAVVAIIVFIVAWLSR